MMMMMLSPISRWVMAVVVLVVLLVMMAMVQVRSPVSSITTTNTMLYCRIHHSDVLMIPTTGMTTTAAEDKDVSKWVGTTTMGVTECYPTVVVVANENSETTTIPLVHEVIVRTSTTSSSSNSDKEELFEETSLVEHVGHTVLYHYLQYDPSWVTNQVIVVPTHVIPNIYHYDHPVIQEHLQSVMWLSPPVTTTANEHTYPMRHPPAPHHSKRHLQRIVTDSTMNKLLAVRVGTADEVVTTSLDEIEQYVFDLNSEESFATIHTACTLGQKNIVPYNVDIPVYDLTLTTGNSSDYTFGSFFTAAEPLILELLFGTTTTTTTNETDTNSTDTMNTTDTTTNSTEPPSTPIPTSLSDVVEYVVLIGPKGLRPTTQQPNFRFVAAGAYNSYKVVITDDWIDTPQVLQHEIGHNYNFGHPWENNVIYGDTTSVMGQVYRNTKFNCYNGVHYDYAGWMENTTMSLDLSENATSMTAMMTDLAFYGHMDRIDDPELTPTLIVMNGFYIMYNRATGINAETNEYANGVLLHRYKEENVSQSGTDLIAVLELSASADDDAVDSRFYSSTEFDMSIELCSQNDSTNDNTPDTVTLVIGTAASRVVCPDRASDTPSSSPVPTVSPAPTISPVPSEMPSDTPTTTPVTARRRRHRRR